MILLFGVEEVCGESKDVPQVAISLESCWHFFTFSL